MTMSVGQQRFGFRDRLWADTTTATSSSLVTVTGSS